MQPSASFQGHKGPVYCLTTGNEPGTFLSGSGDGLVVLWRVADPDHGEVIVRVGQAVFSMCLIADAGLLLIGTEGGGLHVVDLTSRKELHHYDLHRKGLFSMCVLPDQRIACAGGDGTLSVWKMEDTQALRLLRHIPLMDEKLRDLCVAPDGEQLAVACQDGTIRVLDTLLFNELHTLQAHPLQVELDTEASFIGVAGLAFHPNKPVLFSGGKDGHLRLWRSDADHALLSSIPAHKAAIYRMVFSTDGRRLATASRDKSAKVWDATTLDPIARLDRSAGGHTHSVNALLWCGDALITASDDRRIVLWK
ncbi:MAG: WD40 repeat domain-containing protein [Flavobacteriales bacterium]